MTEASITATQAKRASARVRLVFLVPVVVFLGLGGVLGRGLTRDPQELPSALIGKPVPEFALPPLTVADFRGKVVLLNIWATWCGPCREEMPTLDRLQAELGGHDFEVVALSIDRAGIGAVTKFYDEVGLEHLARYIDKSGKAVRQLNAFGLPTTLLIDREGREIARHVGPAEWGAPRVVAFLRQHLPNESSALSPARPANGQADRQTVRFL